MKKILIILLISFGLQTKAQINFCDSIDLGIIVNTNPNIDPTLQTTFLYPSTNNFLFFNFTQYMWTITDASTNAIPGACPLYHLFNENPVIQLNPGINSNFPPADTILICLDVAYDTLWGCNFCDTFVFNPNGLPYPNWIPLSSSTQIISSIDEMTSTYRNDNKIYNILGKELNKIPVGTLYIRNNKKYIIIK